MIKEDIKNLTSRTTITRICDDCGKEEKKTLGEIKASKIKKQNGKDYCKKCSYKYRTLHCLCGEKSPFWKNGMSINKSSGYLRINKTREYYHKVVLGNFLGRKLTKEEQVHHIDLDKLNNDVSNLFLCKNKKEHYSVHYQLELFMFSILNHFTYFSRQDKIYIVDKIQNEVINFKFNDQNIKSIISQTWGNGKKYQFRYLGNRRYGLLHRLVYEQFLGRKIERSDHIHHINGNTLDNDINNLILLNRSQHKICHNSLWDCAKKLLNKNVIQFKDGKYYLCPNI